MPFNRPTIEDLIRDLQADVESRLGLGPLLRRGPLPALTVSLAGQVHSLYGYLAWIARQVFPDTAETAQLDRHAALYGIERKPALAALGFVIFGANDGVTIPVSTRMRRADATEYVTTAEASAVAGKIKVAVAAVLPGILGDVAAGTALTLVSPVPGVRSPGIVDVRAISGGVEEESDEELRGRVLARMQQPPAGGNAADYKAWALEVPGVTRAWVYPLHLGPGTVGVTFTVDDDPGGAIPSPTKVAQVQAYIDARRPVTAVAAVFAPILVELDVHLAVTPNTADVQASVIKSLEDLITREAEPGGTILLSHVREAVSSSPGEVDNTILAPTEDFAAATGELVQLGTVTFA